MLQSQNLGYSTERQTVRFRVFRPIYQTLERVLKLKKEREVETRIGGSREISKGKSLITYQSSLLLFHKDVLHRLEHTRYASIQLDYLR